MNDDFVIIDIYPVGVLDKESGIGVGAAVINIEDNGEATDLMFTMKDEQSPSSEKIAELIAIREALDWILDYKKEVDEFHIILDNPFSLMAIRGDYSVTNELSDIVQDIRTKLGNLIPMDDDFYFNSVFKVSYTHKEHVMAREVARYMHK